MKATKEKVLSNGDTVRVRMFGAKVGSENIMTVAKYRATGDGPSLIAIRDLMIPYTELVRHAKDSEGNDAGPLAVPLAGVFDDYFAGAYDLMAEWLSFTIEAQFGSFFSVGKKSTQPADG